jgi:glucan 1,3-beta-glucosidase
MKFRWGEAVSNHPLWMWQAGLGGLLALSVFAAAWLWRRPDETHHGMTVRWVGVALMALASGLMIGWTVPNVPLESLGIGGWMRSLVLVFAALSAPIACAAALMRSAAWPSFADVLGGADAKGSDRFAYVPGAVFILVTAVAVQIALGLVFDPRYRDFPFAPLTAAILPFVVLRALRPRSIATSGLAEHGAALLLGVAIVYILPNEGLANWQAVWLCALLAMLIVMLVRRRDARSSTTRA